MGSVNAHVARVLTCTSPAVGGRLAAPGMRCSRRGRADAKAELHLRATELRDQLWEIADAKKDESERTFAAVVGHEGQVAN